MTLLESKPSKASNAQIITSIVAMYYYKFNYKHFFYTMRFYQNFYRDMTNGTLCFFCYISGKTVPLKVKTFRPKPQRFHL